MKTHTKLAVLTAMSGAALVGTVLSPIPVQATPASGVTSTPLARGQLDEIDAKVKTGAWKSELRTKGASDVHVIENRFAPGATFGWHSHPGPSLVIIKSGTLSVYHGDDATCTAQTYSAGMGFVDEGGDVHLVRNETAEEVVVIVTSLVPAGATRRIDEPAPGNCGF